MYCNNFVLFVIWKILLYNCQQTKTKFEYIIRVGFEKNINKIRYNIA